MNLNRHVVAPITELTGTPALLGMLVGGIGGTALALFILAVVFGL